MSLSSFFSSSRLAWRQLSYDKVRFLTAVCGVIFATILISMQLGFKDCLFQSATLLQRTMTGQLYMIHQQSEALWRLVPFPRQRLYSALSIDGVKDVTAMYAGQAPVKNPINGVNRTALVLGIDPHSKVYPFEGLAQQQSVLQMRDAALFDEFSKPEFGPIKQIIQDKGYLNTEINGIRIQIAGTYKMGITFSADGNIITNDITFFKLFPNKSQDGVDVGIITLNDGVDPKIVQAKLKKILPPDVQLFTKGEYVADERDYWNKLTPIGFIFNFGAVMGLIVGLVIVYQVLFNDITNHLKEYATLKAMGFKNSYFVKAVMTSAVTLATLGFIPGIVIIYGLFNLIENTIYIQMPMPVSFVLSNFALIVAMCLGSALLAVRKLKSSNPVDIFA